VTDPATDDPQPELLRPWALSPEPRPLFGMGVVWLAFGVTVLAMFAFGVLAVGVARHLAAAHHTALHSVADDPRVLVPAQFAAYGLLLLMLFRYFGHYLRVPMLLALGWRWPQRAWQFVGTGILMAVAVQMLSHWIPEPQDMPIDHMIRTPLDGLLMAGFGVLVAPLVEEILFRGLLFPALARRSGAVVALVASSMLFGALHASQLAGAWAQVALIIAVGALLTLVRWWWHSLAASWLVHAGYNAALFGALAVQTHGFSQFPPR
jgi:membrane protease YdiL (CAAX protease family)